MGTAKGNWREPFTHPMISLIRVTQQKRGDKPLSCHPLYIQNKVHNVS